MTASRPLGEHFYSGRDDPATPSASTFTETKIKKVGADLKSAVSLQLMQVRNLNVRLLNSMSNSEKRGEKFECRSVVFL